MRTVEMALARVGGVRGFARPAVTVAALSAGTCAAAFAWTVSREDRADTAAAAISQLPWQAGSAIVVLLALAALHFLCAAWALSAVSGRRLAIRPTTYVQVAAAATNRVVPNGIGGAAVNLRYLLRVGVVPGAAAGAMVALAVVGAVTDAAYAATLTSAGPSVGVTGAAGELHVLAARGIGRAGQWGWLFAVLVLVVAVGVLLRRKHVTPATIVAASRQALSHARELAAHPARMTGAMVASMLTTVALSVGFVVAVHTWGQSSTPLPTGALVAIYLLASAAGGATPLPPFVGLTEIALVGGLVLAGYTSGSAILAVGLFQLITYWLPLPIGIAMARQLRAVALL